MPAKPQRTASEGSGSSWLARLEIRHSPTRVLRGMETVVSCLSPSATIDPSFERIDAALALIERYAPVRWKQINRDVRRIFVTGGMAPSGVFYRDIATVVVNREVVLHPELVVADVASTIVHEAQHGRLFRLGFGYETGERWRVERICFRAERNFCLRAPDADKALARVNQWLSAGYEEAFSDRSLLQWEIDNLANNGTANWVIRSLTWLADRRFGARPESPSRGAPHE